MDTILSGAVFKGDIKASWIYGDPDCGRRSINWETLNQIGVNMLEPWLCAGDFNDITHHREKLGGRPKDQHKMDGFNDLISTIGMEDLGCKGHRFTWSNNRRGDDRIQERLDRALGNQSWWS